MLITAYLPALAETEGGAAQSQIWQHVQSGQHPDSFLHSCRACHLLSRLQVGLALFMLNHKRGPRYITDIF